MLDQEQVYRTLEETTALLRELKELAAEQQQELVSQRLWLQALSDSAPDFEALQSRYRALLAERFESSGVELPDLLADR